MNRTAPRLVPHCRQAGCAAPPLPLPCHARCTAQCAPPPCRRTALPMLRHCNAPHVHTAALLRSIHATLAELALHSAPPPESMPHAYVVVRIGHLELDCRFNVAILLLYRFKVKHIADHPDFMAEPRNLLLFLTTDSVAPFKKHSHAKSGYSLYPITCGVLPHSSPPPHAPYPRPGGRPWPKPPPAAVVPGTPGSRRAGLHTGAWHSGRRLLQGSHSSFDQVRLQGHAGPSHRRSPRHCQTRAQQLCSLRRGRLHAVRRQRLPHWRDTHLRWPLTMARRSAVTMTSMTLQSNSNAGSVGSLEASTTCLPCSNW